MNRSDGTGDEVLSDRTRTLRAKTLGAQTARSICPYCGVGCGQLAFHRNGQLVAIEGDPESPISRGRLCPKGSASFELLTHPNRKTRVLHRRARSTRWEEIDLEAAMEIVPERVWETRDRTFQEMKDGERVMSTTTKKIT
jgi:formate dehydrogenase major subunit